VTDTVGLDYGPKPRIWKFYTRNKTKLAKEWWCGKEDMK
jgi:hypothetical protein